MARKAELVPPAPGHFYEPLDEDGCMTISEDLPSRAILPSCPGIPCEPYSRSESIPHIMQCIERFCSLHCGADCYGCLRWKTENTSKDDYIRAFIELHIALGYLPIRNKESLCRQAETDCPACSIATAMQAFPTIARYSRVEPIGYTHEGDEFIQSMPCYPKSLDEHCTDFAALRGIDIGKLPPLPPPLLRTVKSAIWTAQAILRYLECAFENLDSDIGLLDSSSFLNNDAATYFDMHSRAKSGAIGIGIGGKGGEGGDGKVVNAPIISTENNTNLAIKKGAFQNNSTFNVAGQGEVVRETRETVFQALAWAKDNPGAVLGAFNGGIDRPNGIGGRKGDNEDQEKADAALWNDWETARAAKIPKAKFAADMGMTINQVQNVLDRHRKRLNS